MAKVAQGVLGFQVVVEKPAVGVTSFAGLVVLAELLRVVVKKKEYRRLAQALGFQSWQTVRRHFESLVLLLASGGEALSDIETLRGDPGLPKLLGFKPSSATQITERGAEDAALPVVPSGGPGGTDRPAVDSQARGVSSWDADPGRGTSDTLAAPGGAGRLARLKRRPEPPRRERSRTRPSAETDFLAWNQHFRALPGREIARSLTLKCPRHP